MQKGYINVKHLYDKFGFPYPTTPQLLDKEHMEIRANFKREEFKEMMEAFERGDLEETIDGLIDLMYVCMGTLVFMGVYVPDHWDEVHRANMDKERVKDEFESKRLYNYDLKKPEGWRPPDHKSLIEFWRDDDGE